MKGKIEEALSLVFHKENFKDYYITYHDRFKGEIELKLKECLDAKFNNPYLFISKDKRQFIIPIHRILKISKVIFSR